MNGSSGLAGMRCRLVPSRPTGLVLRLRGFPVRRGKSCCAGPRNVISDVGWVGMHRDFLTAFAVKVEYPHLVVLQQHCEVIRCHLHRVLCARRRNAEATQSEHAEGEAE